MPTGSPPDTLQFNAAYSAGVTVNSSAFFGAGFAVNASPKKGDNTFDITSAGGQSVITVAGTIGSAGASNGILLTAPGTVLVTAHGRIADHRYGSAIVADAPSTIINVGTASAGQSGAAAMRLNQGGQIVNAAGALIDGQSGGVTSNQQATVINAGSITSMDGWAIALAGGSYALNVKTGMIAGQYGVYLAGGGLVTNIGTIATTAIGLGLQRGGTAFNTGSIASLAGVLLGAGAGLTNSVSGAINARSTGVGAASDAAISNAGAVLSKTGVAVDFYSTGSLTNLAAGTITAATYGVDAAGGAVSVLNAGTINGAYDGANLLMGGSVTNLAAGLISGDRCGVLLTGAAASLSNAGTIRATGAYIALSPTASYVLRAGAGVALVAGASLANGYGGLIAGSYYGVLAHDSGSSVVNQGTITSSCVGVELDGGNSFTNTATGLVVGEYAVYANVRSATIVNAGRIIGSSDPGTGVYLAAGGMLTNLATGTITGGAYGVFTRIASTVVNTGSIGGKFGIWMAGGGTLVTGGTISGQQQAVHMAKSGTLVVEPGAVFVGTVDGVGVGTRIVELASTASAGTIGSIAATGNSASINGFCEVKVDAGARWTLTGCTPMVFLGGGGDTLTVASKANVNITAGAGADTIVLGAGIATLTEAAGSTAGDTIIGFTSKDVIHFTGFGPGAKVIALGGDMYRVGTTAHNETLTVFGATLNPAHNFTIS